MWESKRISPDEENTKHILNHNNFSFNHTLLCEPLIDCSPESETRRRRRLCMLHHEVYVCSTRQISTMFDSAIRRIRHQDQELIIQTYRDDIDNDEEDAMITSYAEYDSGNKKRVRHSNETDTVDEGHLQRVLRIPSMTLPKFRCFRPTPIDTKATSEEYCEDESRQDEDGDKEDDSGTCDTTISPPQAPRNSTRVGLVQHFFPSPRSIIAPLPPPTTSKTASHKSFF